MTGMGASMGEGTFKLGTRDPEATIQYFRNARGSTNAEQMSVIPIMRV